jgi:quercetin dioxygenase-like cupin family protein
MAERTRPNSRRVAAKLTMYQHVISTDALPWLPLEFPGILMRVVHKDPRTGGMTVMTRLEPGASIPAHFHTQADETVFVLSGDFIEAGATHDVGTYFVAAAGIQHGPHESRNGCVVLTSFSAELDFQRI